MLSKKQNVIKQTTNAYIVHNIYIFEMMGVWEAENSAIMFAFSPPPSPPSFQARPLTKGNWRTSFLHLFSRKVNSILQLQIHNVSFLPSLSLVPHFAIFGSSLLICYRIGMNRESVENNCFRGAKSIIWQNCQSQQSSNHSLPQPTKVVGSVLQQLPPSPLLFHVSLHQWNSQVAQNPIEARIPYHSAVPPCHPSWLFAWSLASWEV